MKKAKIAVFLSCVSCLVLGQEAPPVRAGGPPQYFFDGCGTLVMGAECILFQADFGPLLIPANLGGFGVGDHVHVAGEFDPFCVSFCQQGDGCFLDNSIGPCTTDVLGRCCFQGIVAEPVLCAVTTETECFQFAAPVSWTAGENCEGDPCNEVPPPPLGRCCFQGFVPEPVLCDVLTEAECFSLPAPVSWTEGENCDGDPCNEPAGDTFSGCGTLGIGPQGCILFHADSGETFAVNNLGGFFVGDRVWASGTINPSSFACFPAEIPELENNTIGVCFDKCGKLVAGVECVLFKPNGGGTSKFVLDTLGGFNVGDKVHVVGCLNTGCVTVCQQGDGCVEDNTIEPSGPGVCPSGGGVPAVSPEESSSAFFVSPDATKKNLSAADNASPRK